MEAKWTTLRTTQTTSESQTGTQRHPICRVVAPAPEDRVPSLTRYALVRCTRRSLVLTMNSSARVGSDALHRGVDDEQFARGARDVSGNLSAVSCKRDECRGDIACSVIDRCGQRPR